MARKGTDSADRRSTLARGCIEVLGLNRIRDLLLVPKFHLTFRGLSDPGDSLFVEAEAPDDAPKEP
jgi:hypothetical protein